MSRSQILPHFGPHFSLIRRHLKKILDSNGKSFKFQNQPTMTKFLILNCSGTVLIPNQCVGILSDYNLIFSNIFFLLNAYVFGRFLLLFLMLPTLSRVSRIERMCFWCIQRLFLKVLLSANAFSILLATIFTFEYTQRTYLLQLPSIYGMQ